MYDGNLRYTGIQLHRVPASGLLLSGLGVTCLIDLSLPTRGKIGLTTRRPATFPGKISSRIGEEVVIPQAAEQKSFVSLAWVKLPFTEGIFDQQTSSRSNFFGGFICTCWSSSSFSAMNVFLSSTAPASMTGRPIRLLLNGSRLGTVVGGN